MIEFFFFFHLVENKFFKQKILFLTKHIDNSIIKIHILCETLGNEDSAVHHS